MFKRKFTEGNIIEYLDTRPMTLFELKAATCGSHMSIWKLTMMLMKKGIVDRRNRGHPNKPVWEYFLTHHPQLIKVKTEEKKRKLSDLEI